MHMSKEHFFEMMQCKVMIYVTHQAKIKAYKNLDDFFQEESESSFISPTHFSKGTIIEGGIFSLTEIVEI